MFGRSERVSRTRRGDYRLRIPPIERQILRSLPTQLRQLLEEGDPALERLFPSAYPDEPQLDREFRELVEPELRSERLSSIEVMESTLDAERLDEEQLTAWLTTLNDMRLVLGTRLGITEETFERGVPDDHPEAPRYALYSYLGWLEEQIVSALARGQEGRPR